MNGKKGWKTRRRSRRINIKSKNKGKVNCSSMTGVCKGPRRGSAKKTKPKKFRSRYSSSRNKIKIPDIDLDLGKKPEEEQKGTYSNVRFL